MTRGAYRRPPVPPIPDQVVEARAELFRVRLGLQPWDEWASRQRGEFGDRRSGLTTRGLVEGIAHAASVVDVAGADVALVIGAHRPWYERMLAADAIEAICRLGLSRIRVHCSHERVPQDALIVAISDHYWGG